VPGAWRLAIGFTQNGYAALQCRFSGEQSKFRLFISDMGLPNCAFASSFCMRRSKALPLHNGERALLLQITPVAVPDALYAAMHYIELQCL
jgi:hypothetical protein